MLGLTRCKALLCPHCHSERQALLRRDLQALFLGAAGRGLGMAFITLTRAHGPKEPLRAALDGIQDVWRRARDGSPYKRLQARFGLVGVVTVLEVTWSVRGWNPHFHAVVFTEARVAALRCAKALKARFERALDRQGMPVSARTVHVSAVTNPGGLAEYLSKQWHEAQGDGWPPLKLLQMALDGCASSAALFLEVVDALAGRRRITRSRSLRELATITGDGGAA